MEDLETLLLGGPVTLTREDVERRGTVPAEQSSAIWAAMGFAELPYGQPAFTEADLLALQTAASLLELGIIDPDTLLVLTRAMGQGLAKLAEAQLDVFRAMSGGMTVDEAITAAASSADDVLPKLEQLVLFVWRRQFAAAVQRAIASAQNLKEDGLPVRAIAFVDLVNFTRSSRSWDAAQLERTLEVFERDVALRVTAVGGRVVKTLGDGVLYTTDDARSAVQVALETVAAHTADGSLPSVRAGVALGPVLVRLGDVYGEAVNIASRLCDEARPDTVLLDKNAASALGSGEDLDVRPLPRRSVRGYRALTPYLVRRPG